MGVEFKNNVKKAWMKKFVQESPYNVGLDAVTPTNPQTWVTTGHVGNFSDPLVDCRACKSQPCGQAEYRRQFLASRARTWMWTA